MTNSQTIFDYTNNYFLNGNVKSAELSGDYNKNFANSSTLSFNYAYDRSNRLTETNTSDKNFELFNTYDKDGNILTLDRIGSSGSQTDDFNYVYYSGTNKLQRVTGSGTQYTYDANGNMTSDVLNKNTNIKYDHRNLILELTHTKYILNDSLIILTKYYYDEAGNRIRKMSYNTSNDSLINDVVYSRDVSGRELAIYENGSIYQWNIYGMDNIGFIDGNEDIRFYMKDHLGSIRAVTDPTGNVVSSQDYDAWGYLLENRVYDSDVSVYKFTSKERDDESKYDYFGARYYDSRIGRWNATDPLFEKYISYSPYSYVLDNPLIFKDPNGKWTARYDEEAGKIFVTAEENDNFENLYSQLGISGEEFFEKYQDYINDPENFELNAGFELDITDFITNNAIFSKELINVNCFSSSFAPLMGEEPVVINKESTMGKGFSDDLTDNFGFIKEFESRAGYLKIFEDANHTTHHSAIFVIRSQKGIEYFFGRPGPDSKLSIQTSDRLNQIYPDFKTYILSYPKIK